MLSALCLLAARAFAAPPAPDTSPTDSAVVDLSSNDGSNAADTEPDATFEADASCDELVCDEDERARSPLDAGAALLEDSLAVASGLVDVPSLHELEARHQRPSPWGRIDLGIGWRRVERIPDVLGALIAMPGASSRHDEVWLLATWRN